MGSYTFGTYGLEIECLNLQHANVSKEKRLDWTCGRDRSLSYNGEEWRSPVFYEEEDLEKVKQFCTNLKQLGYGVDSTCGLHLHVGMGDFRKDAKAIYAIIAAYHNAENWIYKMMPKSRSTSGYCQKIDAHLLEPLGDLPSIGVTVENFFRDLTGVPAIIEVKKTEDDFVKLQKDFYHTRSYADVQVERRHHGHDKRYYGLNIHSIFYRGTLELRYHSGTINFGKIRNWREINMAIIDFAIKHKNDDADDFAIMKQLGSLDTIRKGKIFPKNLCDYIEERTKLLNKTNRAGRD